MDNFELLPDECHKGFLINIYLIQKYNVHFFIFCEGRGWHTLLLHVQFLLLVIERLQYFLYFNLDLLLVMHLIALGASDAKEMAHYKLTIIIIIII